MAGKPQRLGKNSVTNVVKLVSELSEKVALPEGVILRNDEEMVIWDQFTQARARAGWRDFDLLILAKAVRLEADIRHYQQQLDSEHMIISNDKGTRVVNPMLSVIDSLQRQQLSLIRSLSLNQTAQDPRTLNSQGKEQSKLRGSIQNFDDLIPRQ